LEIELITNVSFSTAQCYICYWDIIKELYDNDKSVRVANALSVTKIKFET